MIGMRLEMSLRIVQPPRKAAFDAVGMPGTAWLGTEVSSNLPVRVLVAVEVSLSCFADATVAGVWLRMSVDVLAGE